MDHEKPSFFSYQQKISFLVIVFLGIFFRFFYLDYRPFHHDESLHGIYANYIFKDPQNGFYQYNPLLHGPFLYNIVRVFYYLLGVNHFSARFLTALIGSLILLFPWMCRSKLKSQTVLILTFFLSFSPSLIYWSRFIREDYPVVLCMLLLFYAVFFLQKNLLSFIALFAFSLTFTMKENSYVHLALILGIIFFEKIFNLIFVKDQLTWIDDIKHHVKKNWPGVILGLGLSIFVYCYLYSGGFNYSKGILDGLYRESLKYWMQQHSIERIKGPFLFQFFFLSWYEGLFILSTFLQIFILSLQSRAMRWWTIISFLPGIMLYLLKKFDLFHENFFWQLFKCKIDFDYIGPFFLILYSLGITSYYLKNRERTLATFSYFYYASFFTYSYLGEKVPWLSLYIFFPGIIFLTYFFQEQILKNKEKIVNSLTYANALVVLSYIVFIFSILLSFSEDYTYLYILGPISLLLFFSSYLFPLSKTNNHSKLLLPLTLTFLAVFHLQIAFVTNASRAGTDTEFIGQVHTSPMIHQLALDIRQKMSSPLLGYYPRVLVLDDAIWPLSWYFRDLPGYEFNFPGYNYDNYDYIFKNTEVAFYEMNNYNHVTIDLRGWWVPDYNVMTFRKFFFYALSHSPWNPPGQMKIHFYARKSF